MIVKFGDVERKAHACVVASFSPFVDKWMSSGEVESPVSVPLDLDKFSCPDCATKVIDFMYIGKIQIENQHLKHILAASEALQVSELIKICRKHSDKNCSSVRIDRAEAVELTVHSDDSGKFKDPNDLSCWGRTALSDFNDDARHTNNSRETTSHSKNSVNDDDIDESEWCGIKCPKCNLIFMSLAKYQQHCSTHLGKTLTTCFVCNYASIRVSDVVKHLLEEDHGERVCSICLLEVSSSQNLKDHLQVHNQTQPFLCLTCNTRFQTRTALHSHIVRHTIETPFVCKECGRGFKWKHGLQNHMVTHSKLKTFLCDECGYSTAHLRSFIDHKTIHSGEKFKCPKPDCQFTSVRKESVKHHLMTHSKEKPYQCEVCGQAFSQAKNLRRHAASHDPLTDPEKCPLCSYQTFRSDKLKVHFRQYHKDEEVIGTKRKQKRNTVGKTIKSIEDQYSKNNLVIPPVEDSGLSSCNISRCKESIDDSMGDSHNEATPKITKKKIMNCSTSVSLSVKKTRKFQEKIKTGKKYKLIGGSPNTCERKILPKCSFPNDCISGETLLSNTDSTYQNVIKIVNTSPSPESTDESTALHQSINVKSSPILASNKDVILMLNNRIVEDNIIITPNPTKANEEIIIFEAEEVIASTSSEFNMIQNGSPLTTDPVCFDFQAAPGSSDSIYISAFPYSGSNTPQCSNLVIAKKSLLKSHSDISQKKLDNNI
ncbi:Zinc finger protein 425 [Frankliniella fusca]|uniref:Zinc finger protein 425 n=1 Tax=Frankliniella fusca TaxID=407009 RepID=A0AAE1HD41_9NEOP|nr:Zinc finger protein 425 [Frankliniella fusca]